MTMIEHVCAWHLPSDRSIARRARELAALVLPCMNVEAESVEAALLVASELATNAHCHARPPYGLCLWCAGRIAVIEVVDAGPHLGVLPGLGVGAPCGEAASLHGPGEESGRGLALVRHFAQGRCGVESSAAGKKVWAALDRVKDGLRPAVNPALLALRPSRAQLVLADSG